MPPRRKARKARNARKAPKARPKRKCPGIPIHRHVRKGSRKVAPRRVAPKRKAPARKAPARKAPERKAPERKAPERKAPEAPFVFRPHEYPPIFVSEREQKERERQLQKQQEREQRERERKQKKVQKQQEREQRDRERKQKEAQKQQEREQKEREKEEEREVQNQFERLQQRVRQRTKDAERQRLEQERLIEEQLAREAREAREAADRQEELARERFEAKYQSPAKQPPPREDWDEYIDLDIEPRQLRMHDWAPVFDKHGCETKVGRVMAPEWPRVKPDQHTRPPKVDPNFVKRVQIQINGDVRHILIYDDRTYGEEQFEKTQFIKMPFPSAWNFRRCIYCMENKSNFTALNFLDQMSQYPIDDSMYNDLLLMANYKMSEAFTKEDLPRPKEFETDNLEQALTNLLEIYRQWFVLNPIAKTEVYSLQALIKIIKTLLTIRLKLGSKSLYNGIRQKIESTFT
jgi:hypothetical protein